MKNKNGIAFFSLLTITGCFHIAFATVLAMALWHIPAWEDAKDKAAYQAQEMWPQQLFDKLPGGTPGRKVGQ